MLLTGEDVAVNTGAFLLGDLAERIGAVSDLLCTRRIREVGGRAQCTVVIEMVAATCDKAEQAVAVTVVVNQARGIVLEFIKDNME